MMSRINSDEQTMYPSTYSKVVKRAEEDITTLDHKFYLFSEYRTLSSYIMSGTCTCINY